MGRRKVNQDYVHLVGSFFWSVQAGEPNDVLDGRGRVRPGLGGSGRVWTVQVGLVWSVRSQRRKYIALISDARKTYIPQTPSD